jgi:drug/metabolite transporter (DMT)-like permease
VVGFLLLVVGNGAVSVAEHWVSSGATVALISTMPLATALWCGAFGDWPRRGEWIAIALGGAGAVVMLLGRDLQGNITGTLLILFGTISWSLGTVLSRRLDIPHGPTGFGAEMLTAGVMGMVISAALGEHWTVPHVAHVWWAFGYLVVFGSLIAFSAYRFVVERVSPSLAATYAYVNPPVALLVAGGWAARLFPRTFSWVCPWCSARSRCMRGYSRAKRRWSPPQSRSAPAQAVRHKCVASLRHSD